MPKITKDQMKPAVFENDDYRLEFRKYPFPDYRVLNKKNNINSELQINEDWGAANIDEECQLSYIQDNKEPMILTAVFPCRQKRDEEAWEWHKKHYFEAYPDPYKNEPPKQSPKDFGTYLEPLMRIYRGLKKGDFEKGVSFFKRNSAERTLKKYTIYDGKKEISYSYSKEEATENILNFMDSYIFNTDESREVLAEYMQKYPLPLKDEEIKDNPQVPSKEELKKYPSGSSWVARLAQKSKLLFNRLVTRDGRK